MKRGKIKKLLAGLEREQPGIKASLLAALADVEHRHLLMNSSDASRVTRDS
jgi:tRNA(Ile)-lysidine synthase TilS/MesJ